ncbi:MAG: flagellar basal body rod protein FlgB [Candidatus Sulfotelmatobacter sp.]|jgi:flagellar basal-body rod protein FlgB
MSMIETKMMGALGRFLDVDVARLKLIGSNLANIDTPGFRTRDLDFRAELSRAAAEESAEGQAGLSYASYGSGAYGHAAYARASYAPMVKRVRGLLERPDGNNVSVERESLLLAETQMKYNLGVQLLKDEFHGISQAINSGGGTSQ